MSEKTLKPAQYASFYLLWIVSGTLCVLDWLTLRSAITDVAAVMANAVPLETQIRNQRYLRWTVPVVDKFALVLIGLCAILSIFALDYYDQAGLLKGRIKKRFGTITAIQIGILAVSGAVIWIASSAV